MMLMKKKMLASAILNARAIMLVLDLFAGETVSISVPATKTWGSTATGGGHLTPVKDHHMAVG